MDRMFGKVTNMSKSAKKRAARRAFFESGVDISGAKYLCHVIEYRDGIRRHLRFMSRTHFNKYKANQADQVALGVLRFVEPDQIDDTKGKASRTRVINKGIGQNHDRAERPAYLVKGTKEHKQAASGRFYRNGFKATDIDALRSTARDILREIEIKGERIRPSHKGKLEKIRQKYRTI